MPENRKCRGCEADVPANAPFGHCPKCLLDLGFGPIPDEDEVASSVSANGNRVFGDYELLEQIGRGGMGVVYKARQMALNRPVALKMINAGEFASPMLIQRFHREAEAAASLHHPNIVPIYETGEKHGQHYLSMALIEGLSLDEHVQRSASKIGSSEKDARAFSRRRQEDIARLIAKVARAVDFAHQHGVLHRDLKPSNIIVDQDGEPHLTDFGVAKVLGSGDSNLTASGAVMGTPCYMALEQAAGHSKRSTTAADVYSLGAILYAMLTGSPPFRADTPVETLRQVIEQEPKHPSTLKEGIDSDLATIAMKCLEKEPQRHYSSACALAEDLERWTRREPIVARSIHTTERFWRWCRRNPRVAGLSASVVVLLLTVTVLSTVVAIRIGWEAEAKRESLGVLQRDVIRSLEEMWMISNQRYVTITSEKLAALRGELSPGGQTNANRLALLFAVYTHEKPSTMLSNMAPVLAVLERSMTRTLSRPVQIDLRIYRLYDDAKDALVRGKVHFVRFGSASYVEAKKLNPQISLLLSQNGKVRGYIFTRADSGIQSLADLKGKLIAFVDDSSTTGNYLPKRTLFEHSLTAMDLRGRGTNFLGSHDSVVEAVAKRACDAGACNSSIVDKFMKDTGVEFRILHNVKETKGLPWVARPGLDPRIAREICAGLLSIKDKAVLERLKNDTTGFEQALDEDHDSIREAMRQAENFDGALTNRPATQ